MSSTIVDIGFDNIILTTFFVLQTKFVYTRKQKFINLSKRLNLPTKIRELGIPKKACREMSIEAMKQERLLINNPIGLTQKDIQKIYEQAW